MGNALRKYPVERPSSAPATGRIFYAHLMENLKIPAHASHTIWYEGEKAKLTKPDVYAFRGALPVGNLIVLVSLGGKPIPESGNARPSQDEQGCMAYIFTGRESPVLVSDLSPRSRLALGIPEKAMDSDKVFNPNFVEYEQLPEMTRISNELTTLALAKSISSFFGGINGRVNYSERNVLEFLKACFGDLSSQEMMHVMHGNHVAWATLAYARSGGGAVGDILTEFHGQDSVDFYIKDIGTILPSMFYAAACLGYDPIDLFKKLDVEIWGAEDAARYMRRYMLQKK